MLRCHLGKGIALYDLAKIIELNCMYKSSTQKHISRGFILKIFLKISQISNSIYYLCLSASVHLISYS